MQAPSQPTPSALQPLSVKTEPSSVGMSDVAPCFIRPRAVTKAPRPMHAEHDALPPRTPGPAHLRLRHRDVVVRARGRRR